MRRFRPDTTLAAIVSEGFISRLGFSMVGFALPLYALALGMSLTEIGALYAIRTAATIAAKPVMAIVSDRIGHKRTLVAAAALRSVVGLLFVFATEPWHLYAIRLVHGVMTAAREPSAAALIAERAEGGRLGLSFASYSTARDLGRSVGYAAAGFLIDLTAGYHAVFLIGFLTSLAGLIAVARYVPRPAAVERSAPPMRVPLAAYRALLPQVAFGLQVATGAEMVAGLYPVLARDYAHLSAAEAGVAASASAVAVLLAGPAFGWIADRFGRHVVLASRSAANVLASILYAVAPTFGGFTAARVVDDAGKAAFRPAWGTLLADAARGDAAHRARLMTFVDTSYNVGEAVGPMLAGALISIVGIPGMLAVRAGLALTAELHLIRRGRLERRELPTMKASEAA